MTHFDAAAAAVQAALDAGRAVRGRAGDAPAQRVHVRPQRRDRGAEPGRGRRHRRTRAGRLRLGLLRRTRPVRRRRPRGRHPRREDRRRERARVPGPADRPGAGPGGDAGLGRRPATSTRCRVPLSDKGDLLVARHHDDARARRRPRPRRTTAIWDTAKWFVSSEGHRIDQRIRECGGGIVQRPRSATARSQRRSYGTAPVRHPRLGAGHRARPARQRRPDGRGVARAADRARSARPARPR